MTLNKRLTIRVSDIDMQQINALKHLKKSNKQVFNLSELVRLEIKNILLLYNIIENDTLALRRRNQLTISIMR